MYYINEFNMLKHHIITNYGQPNWLLLIRGTGLTLHDPEVQPLRDLWYGNDDSSKLSLKDLNNLHPQIKLEYIEINKELVALLNDFEKEFEVYYNYLEKRNKNEKIEDFNNGAFCYFTNMSIINHSFCQIAKGALTLSKCSVYHRQVLTEKITVME